jgi:hypothetical protein
MFPFRKLGIGAGGVKGILHIGALQELAKHQPLQFPDGIYGCSVGSVIATYLSFNLPIDDRVVDLTARYLSFDKLLPKPTFNDIRSAFSEKGVFSMDQFEQNIVEMFSEAGVDIKTKKIGDALQPLHIIASNISKGVPTIFTKDVPILDALKCSCCVPGIFKPQNLYGQLYIDGVTLVPCISWLQPDALVLSLTKQSAHRISPETLPTISAFDFMEHVYAMSVAYFVTLHKSENVLTLTYPGLYSNSNLDDFDIPNVLETAQGSMRGFLASKGFLQEVTEVGDSGSTDHLI